MKKSLVFFGNERIATGVSTQAPTLKALIHSGYTISAVVINYEKATSRNSRTLEIADVAQYYNIPIITPDSLPAIKDQLSSYSCEAAVLVAYGRIIPQSIIDLFPRGIINIHPSLLPKHRGPTPIESTIINGEHKAGVSIMQLSKAMDAGPLFGQAEITLSGVETKQELADKLLRLGSKMLIELLPGILDGTTVAFPQETSEATYDLLIRKSTGILDWQKPAAQLEREIRAFAGWPKSRTVIAGKDVTITSATATTEIYQGSHVAPGHFYKAPGNLLGVTTGKGSLIIDKLIPSGKQEMPAPAFLAGYNIE